jgi:cytochrome P450
VDAGAPLARLELRVLVEELLARSTDIAFVEGLTFTRAVYPDAGYATLRVCLR